MGENLPLPPSQDTRGIANHFWDVDPGYVEEAALFAEMKALRTRVAAHCVNSNKKKFKTEATAFLRDIVQHLPENPMQVPGSRSSIMANLVSGAPGNFSAPTPSTPGLGRVPHQGHPSSVESSCAHQARAIAFALSDQHALPPPLSATPSPFSAGGHRITMTVGNPPLPIVNLQAAHQAHDQALAELYALPRPPLFPATPSTPSPGGHRIVMSAGTPSLSTPDLLAIPHSQKCAGEDAWGDFPQFHSSPGYSPASCNNTPEPSSHTRYISTPHNRPSYPSFVLGPPETPSPRNRRRRALVRHI
ncbi:hypothetical protein B0H14DRAFT_3494708 [Mycena olivaceomarginata]|nr:hypothetical protein B0H14DRAFT_3494708 [Mycena olivaceomarginata]